jgi:hypothetical protein
MASNGVGYALHDVLFQALAAISFYFSTFARTALLTVPRTVIASNRQITTGARVYRLMF